VRKRRVVLDIIAFGGLILAIILDSNPTLAGGALLVVGGGLCYLCTRELVALLFPERLESAESFATNYALLVIGFAYFFRRNDSDFIQLVLTIALMMASLMLAIALIGCLSERRLRPFLQLVGITVATTVLAGMFAHLVLLPTVVPNQTILIAVIVASWVWWLLAQRRASAHAQQWIDEPTTRLPSRALIAFAFVSTFLIGLIGAALAVSALGGSNVLLKSGRIAWLVAVPGFVSVLLWEAVRPGLMRETEEPLIIPFVRGRLLDRMIPLLFIATVLFYYFWSPRG